MGKVVVVLIILLMVSMTIAGFIVENNSDAGEVIGSPDNSIAPVVVDSDFGVRTKSSGCSFDYLPLADPSCTVGAVFPNLTKDDICWSGYSASVRDVSESLKNEVYESYGVYSREPYEYEIDHYVPLSIGGSNDVSNLFPEKYNMTLGARTKDKVENCFHRKVCDGSLDLSLAQHIMATNWTEGMDLCGVVDG